jgi:hypothetical protein
MSDNLPDHDRRNCKHCATATIRLLRERVRDAANALNDEILAACPGEHRLVQHRDGKPPWCEACGRDGMGRQVRP